MSPRTPEHGYHHAVHLLFLEPSARDPWLNRATSIVGARVHGRGFCHAEICIPHFPRGLSGGQQGYLSSSIYNGETVNATVVKTFANPGYAVHTELVTWPQLERIATGISEARRRELKFDGLGMYLAALPFYTGLGGGSGDRTFCSRCARACPLLWRCAAIPFEGDTAIVGT